MLLVKSIFQKFRPIQLNFKSSSYVCPYELLHDESLKSEKGLKDKTVKW